MRKNRPANTAPCPPSPPGYYWWKYKCKLSQGYGEWQVVRWDGERVQVFGSSHPWKLTSLFVQGGLWGPRIFPAGESLDGPTTCVPFTARPRKAGRSGSPGRRVGRVRQPAS